MVLRLHGIGIDCRPDDDRHGLDPDRRQSLLFEAEHPRSPARDVQNARLDVGTAIEDDDFSLSAVGKVGYQKMRAKRIRPAGGIDAVGVEWVAAGHQAALFVVTIPGSKSNFGACGRYARKRGKKKNEGAHGFQGLKALRFQYGTSRVCEVGG
jgi:hypothetical protein